MPAKAGRRFSERLAEVFPAEGEVGMAEVLSVADVSHHQGLIVWDLFAPAIDAVIIKAGGGDGKRKSDGKHVLLYKDSQLKRNRDEARRRGLPVWFYYFAGCGRPAAEEADHFASLVAEARDDEALVLDYEPFVPPSDPVRWCVDFIKRVKQVTGRTCLFYTNEDRVLSHAWGPVAATGARLWAAKYGPNDGKPHTPPKAGAWPQLTAWQYTSVAKLPGLPAKVTVDMNQYFGDVAQFRAHGKRAGAGEEDDPMVFYVKNRDALDLGVYKVNTWTWRKRHVGSAEGAILLSAERLLEAGEGSNPENPLLLTGAQFDGIPDA